jgi:hypothetical protein
MASGAVQGKGKWRTAVLLALLAAGMFAYTLWYGGR